jgi:hypothetical protein
MRTRAVILLLSSITLVALSTMPLYAAEMPAQVRIDADDIGGVVTETNGPEAGVWVIAETFDLPTKFSRVVVTDDRGRFVVPDLPTANYEVWVRGYGLVDSPRIKAAPGKLLMLNAVPAPDAKAAAQYYPANYWFAMLEIPDKSEFPGTGRQGNGIGLSLVRQEQWINAIKTSSCQACHQLGNKATRETPEAFLGLNTYGAWEARTSAGQAGGIMANILSSLGRERVLKMFAGWTDRIASGDVPFAQPQRPQGIERNIVVSTWDYSDAQKYVHDAISTDKRDPRINANGPIYGAPEDSSDRIAVLDPVRNMAYDLVVPVRDPNTPYAPSMHVQSPSAYFGSELIWDSKTSPHSSMIDGKGRLWTTSVIRPPENPDFCKERSTHPSAKLFPLKRSGRQVSVYDPTTKKFALIDTCFMTHHLMFASDDKLWFSGFGGDDVVGWLDTKLWDQTHDEQKAQGWTALVLDTNGNGKRDDYVEPDSPVDPSKDKRIHAVFYSVVENPIDHTIWGSVNAFPGAVVRLSLGSNPPTTTLAEIYEPPFDNSNAPVQGYTPRGIDVDRRGVIWTNLTGSSQLASFDRRKCKGPLNGPKATGQHCPEGWTLYPLPGPNFKNVMEPGSATSSYLLWVDQFNTFGMGQNTPIIIGNGADALYALDTKIGKFVTIRVPYPLSFFAKGIDGRIDAADTGWKGRGLWASSGTRAAWHVEGGLGEKPKVYKFQLRPNPLAH